MQSVNIDVNDLHINKKELAKRLKTPVGFENDAVTECEMAVRKAMKPRYFVIKVDVKTNAKDIVKLDEIEIYSKDLYKNLLGCNRAYIMAVTLGMEIDRLISSLRIVSPAKAFIADAIASAFAEAAADYVSEMLSRKQKLKPRYSPGYGDLSLSVQKDVLNILNADKILGIKLGENLLMTPKKSITAIQGVID